MDRRELKQQYKETEVLAGVFQIRNRQNGKIYLCSNMNLKVMNRQQFQLELHSHPNKQLQHEWISDGKEAFVFEILETLSKEDRESLRAKDLLQKLEEKWLNQLQPFGERGYHV